MKLFFSLILLFIFHITSAQIFETSLTTGHGYIISIIPTQDGGAYLIGAVSQAGGKQIIRFDANGNIVWAKNYTNGIFSACKLGSNQFVAYDIRDSLGWNPTQLGQFCKFDSSGFLLSAITLAESLEVNIIHPTNDGGTLALGYVQGSQNQRIFRTDSLGNFIWVKEVDTTFSSKVRMNNIIETYDGGYVVTGNYQYPDTPSAPYHNILIRYNNTFDTLWTRSYDSLSLDGNIVNTTDHGLLITSGGSPNFITFFDSVGTIRWSKAFLNDGFPMYEFSSCVISSDSNFIFSGLLWDGGVSNCMMKTDTAGNILWSRIYSNKNSTVLHANANDGGIFLGLAGGTNQDYMALIKTDATGVSVCDATYPLPPLTNLTAYSAPVYRYCNPVDIQIGIYSSPDTPYVWDSSFAQQDYCAILLSTLNGENENEIEIFPNPATNQLSIKSLKHGNDELEIFNSLGEKIYSSEFSGQLTIDSRKFPRGIYFVRVSNSENVLTRKLMIE